MRDVVDQLLEAVTEWAVGRPDIRGVALVGSHARGTAGPDSDVDLVIVTERPRELVRDTSWTGGFGAVDRNQEEDWGRVTSLRTWYASGLEVEFAVTDEDWARDPDEGTLRVVRDGCRVLYERRGVFDSLLRA